MKSFTYIFSTICFTLFTFYCANAQQNANWCGQAPMDKKFRLEHPEHLDDIINAEIALKEATQDFQNQRGARATKVIPVVFHIIHQNGTENISDAQIYDQIRILNEDYNATNSDLADVIPDFTSIIGDMDIEFRLAKKDPNGNLTNGIDRIVSTQTTNGSDAAKLNPWSRSKYLNIWVVKSWNSSIPSGVLAYAYKPASVVNSASVDGIICLSQYIGSIGTGLPLYARTISHEVGHFLNLSHTWGDTNEPGLSTNCNSDDGVTDTPLCIGSYGCNTSTTSCNSLDNIQNHMDYADCTVMFSIGQTDVAAATLNSSVSFRSNLSRASNLSATGVDELILADFSANRLSFCEYETINFSDLSEYDASIWNWDFPNGINGSSAQKNPTEIYPELGVFNVSLSASNGNQLVTKTKLGYIHVNPRLGRFAPYAEDFSTISNLNHEYWYAVNDFEDEYLFNVNPDNGYDQSACLLLNNHGNLTETSDELLTTTFDLRMFSQVTVSFKTAYAQKSTTDRSKLSLYVSGDCGETWSLKWSGIGSTLGNTSVTTGYYIPSSNNDWKTTSINTIGSSELAQANQFKFVFENNEGNNLYLDDFNITGSYSSTAQLKYPLDEQTNVPNNQTIYWKAMGGGVDSYEYQLDTDANFNTSNLQSGIQNFIAITDGLDTEFQPSNLVNGSTYYWRVRLIKSGQTQSWSDTWSFTVSSNGLFTDDILAAKYQLKVYPNPMTDIGILEFSLEESSFVSVRVTNTIGKTYVLQETQYFGFGTHVLNLSEFSLSKGLYVIEIQIGVETIHQKFIVQ